MYTQNIGIQKISQKPIKVTKSWLNRLNQLGQVQNDNLCIKPSSPEKLLVIICIGSIDLVKVAIAFNVETPFIRGC